METLLEQKKKKNQPCLTATELNLSKTNQTKLVNQPWDISNRPVNKKIKKTYTCMRATHSQKKYKHQHNKQKSTRNQPIQKHLDYKYIKKKFFLRFKYTISL